MADNRRRVYYTKDQITDGLLTDGEEFMSTSGIEYKGQYHKYSTGEVFTEATYIDGKSSKLIPYVDLNNDVTSINGISIDLGKSFEYDGIKEIEIPSSSMPNSSKNKPIDSDYYKGYVIRYFGTKVNEDRVIELSEKDFKKVGKSNGLPKLLWNSFLLRWKVSGQIDDILNPNGTINQPGVISTNKRTIDLLSEDYPTLRGILTNLTEFYQP